MLSYLEDIKAKYVRDISNYLPIQRAGIYFLLLFYFGYYFQFCPELQIKLKPAEGFWLYLINTNVKYFLSTTDGIFFSTEIKYHILSIVITLIASFLNTHIKKGFYDFFIIIYPKFEELISGYKKEANEAKNSSAIINLELARDLSVQLDRKEKQASFYTALSEFLVGVAIVAILNLFFTRIFISINTAIIITSIVAATSSYYISTKHYLEEYLPLFTMLKALKGESLE